jgi:hypothetical protein
MKSFKTILNEGRLEEGLFHSLVKAHLKTQYKNKRMVCYYDESVSSNNMRNMYELLGVVRIHSVLNSKGDCAYDYEAI